MKSVKECFKDQGKEVIMFDRHVPNTRGSSHAHIQVLPVSKEAAEKAASLFMDEGNKVGLNFTKVPEEVPYEKVSVA